MSRMSRNGVARNALIAVLSLAAAGRPALAGQAPASVEPTPAAAPPSYRLTPGDVVDIKFPYHPELNESVPLRPDGYISLPMIGDVHADKRTPVELAAVINDQYAKLIRLPEASVIVREFTPQRAYIGGEVIAPGAVDLRGRITSLQAVLKTGGLKTSARLDGVLLIRYTGNDKAEVRTLNFKRVLEGRDEDTVLQAFDVLFVPLSKIGRVGLFIDQYVNNVIPKSLLFPYNLNTVWTFNR